MRFCDSCVGLVPRCWSHGRGASPVPIASAKHINTAGKCRTLQIGACAAFAEQLHPHLQAEAERFVTRPFLMGTHDAPQAIPSPLQAGAALRAERSGLQTRKTTSVFAPAP